jgi:subfamily B ATP-binding cassette protein HlyB/CyaB
MRLGQIDSSAPTTSEPATADINIAAFGLILRFYEIALDPAQIRHQFGAIFGASEILRAAKQFKLKARASTADWRQLHRMPLPALAGCRDGSFIIVAKVADEKVLIQDPQVGRLQLVGRADFEARWTGRLILIARRASLGNLGREFNITWFLHAIHKYRWILGEMLLACSSCNCSRW